MDFSFTQEQKMIKDAVRDFMKRECPSDLVREMEQDDKGYSRELWRRMAEDVRAIRRGNNFLINGTKLFVPYAHVADYIVCSTRTKDGEKKEDGITLFLIDGKNPGVSCMELKTMACDKQNEVVFKQARITARNILGKYGKGWGIIKRVLERATMAQCALMIGGAEKVLEMTVAYAKNRTQFGRPIGSFQAIQHRCANMKIDLDGARFVTYEAACKLDQGLACTLEVSVAKAWVNQAYNRICANGHQINGGSGVIKDHEMHLYSRRAKAAEFLFGDTNSHREIVAQQLGL
jgi:alkylation response protein AidB-like acyl-CoA dehydrogenase